MTTLTNLNNRRGVELEPIVNITFQQRGTTPAPSEVEESGFHTVQDVISINSNQLHISGRVDKATDETQSGATASIDITNLPKDVARQIDPLGFVRIEGGYQGQLQIDESRTKKSGEAIQPIFYGTIKWFSPHRRGPETVWRFNASTATGRTSTIPINLSFEEKTIGYIMEKIAAYIGADITIPPSVKGKDPSIPTEWVTLNQFTTKESATKELKRLIEKLNHRIDGSQFRLVTVSDTPLAWELIDMNAQQDVTRIVLHHDKSVIYSSDITPVQGAVDEVKFAKLAAEAENALGTRQEMEKMEKLTEHFRYKATIKFDPRYELGGWVVVKDPDGIDAIVNLDSVLHRFGADNWRTQIAGNIVYSDELADFVNRKNSLRGEDNRPF